jgi:uncharacterized membrane protein
MKQPLLFDDDSGAPRKSVLTSCKNEERRSRTTTMILLEIYLVGFAAGLVLQAITISASMTILKVWGREEPQPQEGLSNRVLYYILFLLSQADIAVYFIMTVIVLILFIARSVSIYRRKKFDHEDGTSTKEGVSIWCITFLFGIMVGSFYYTKMGMPLSLGPLVTTILFDLLLVILPVTFRYFYWAKEHQGDDETSSTSTSTDDEVQQEEEAGALLV